MESSNSSDPKLKLYSHWLSSCSWRVLIALNLKGLCYEYKAVNLVKGEQFTPEFLELNPIGYVPALADGDTVIADSFAIILTIAIAEWELCLTRFMMVIHYLEDKYPQHPLLPKDLKKKAINIQAANIVSSSIQPFQNNVVVKYIGEKIGVDERVPWVQIHIIKGFTALEKLLKGYAGKYATGDEVFLADVFLAPQINAAITRFAVDMSQFPLLSNLNEAYMELPAFQAAMPDAQPDYVKP